ncbi:hypothetical protein pb186bvf_020252 [Paramecium bursaria]
MKAPSSFEDQQLNLQKSESIMVQFIFLFNKGVIFDDSELKIIYFRITKLGLTQTDNLQDFKGCSNYFHTLFTKVYQIQNFYTINNYYEDLQMNMHQMIVHIYQNMEESFLKTKRIHYLMKQIYKYEYMLFLLIIFIYTSKGDDLKKQDNQDYMKLGK